MWPRGGPGDALRRQTVALGPLDRSFTRLSEYFRLSISGGILKILLASVPQSWERKSTFRESATEVFRQPVTLAVLIGGGSATLECPLFQEKVS